MPFNPLLPFDLRLGFHTDLYVAFRQRGRVQQVHVQVNNAVARPFFWLDDLNFGARFGPRGILIEQRLQAGDDPANITLQDDCDNPTGCTFVSGLSGTNVENHLWQAPLALALGMTPRRGTAGQEMEPNSRGRFMVKQGTGNPIWLGHRGGLGGGGAGVVDIDEFHNLLPRLRDILENNPRHLSLIPGLELDFGQVFAYNFVPDLLVRPLPQEPQPVFPIATLEAKDFFETLASYVHQCYVLRRLRQEGII